MHISIPAHSTLRTDTVIVSARLEDAGGNNAGAAYVFQEPSVGGIAEPADVATSPVETSGSSVPSLALVAAIAAAVVIIAVASTAWYAKRRWGR